MGVTKLFGGEHAPACLDEFWIKLAWCPARVSGGAGCTNFWFGGWGPSEPVGGPVDAEAVIHASEHHEDSAKWFLTKRLHDPRNELGPTWHAVTKMKDTKSDDRPSSMNILVCKLDQNQLHCILLSKSTSSCLLIPAKSRFSSC